MPIVRGGYGYDLFGSSDYGTEGSFQDASATVTAASSMSASGGRSITGSAALTATTGFTSTAAYRIRESGAAVSSTSATTAVGEAVVIKRSDKLPYGGGLYGYEVYDNADLQTIVVAQSVNASVNGIRVQNGSGSVTATSATTGSGEKIHQTNAGTNGISSATASAVYTIKASAAASVTSSVSISFIRKRNASALTAGTTATLAAGREKFEIIAPTVITYTTIAA